MSGSIRPAAFRAIVGIAGLLVTGCAVDSTPSPTPLALAPSAERGRQVAEQNCSTCHALDATSASPSAMAPPFRALRIRYNPIGLERHIANLTERGYYGMAPRPISRGDAEAVAAYIETLRTPEINGLP